MMLGGTGAIGAALLAIAPVSAAPQPAPSASSLQSQLAGEWEGALGYSDYQSNELFELPVKTVIEAVPDGATQVRRSVYDEGARKAPVWIISLLQWTKDGKLATAVMRAGREPELLSEAAEVTSYSSPANWVVTYRRTGTDDDKPADIKVTETRTGDELLSVKEVRPVGSPSAPWQFRNQVRLKKVR